MWWYGRRNSGGSWLPKEKKANMWHGRGISGGLWPPASPRSYTPHTYIPYTLSCLQIHVHPQYTYSLYTIMSSNICKPPIHIFLIHYHVFQYLYTERGKAGGHEPPLFPLPCHILAFFSFGSHEPPLFLLPYHHIWLFRAKLLF